MDAQTTLGASLATLEAEAAWFVSQGHSPETVALWIDEPVQFVLNAVGDPWAGTWHVWVREKWQRRMTVVEESIPTPKQIDRRAARVREASMRRKPPNQRWTKEEVLKALRQSDGNPVVAAKRLGCHVSTVLRR